jgi:hypothetical protein
MLAVESVVRLFMSFERPEMLLEWCRSSSQVVLEHIYEYLSGGGLRSLSWRFGPDEPSSVTGARGGRVR